jgi:hypothetical protein
MKMRKYFHYNKDIIKHIIEKCNEFTQLKLNDKRVEIPASSLEKRMQVWSGVALCGKYLDEFKSQTIYQEQSIK